MATHFVCQATEPIPHKFPTSRKAEKGHGAVSQYEVLNIANKKHTQFPPPGWDTSQSSEDSLPLCQAPAPVWKVPSKLTGPDPDLCLTPERGLTNRNISDISLLSQPPEPTQDKPHHLICPDPQLSVTPEKQFNNNSNQEYKSNLKQDGDINFKNKKPHRVRFNVEDTKSRQSDVLSQLEEKSGAGLYSVSNKTYKPTSYSDQDEFIVENEENFQFPENKQIYAFNTNSDVGVKKPFAFSMKDDGKDSGIELCDRLTYDEDVEEYVPVLPEVLADSTPELDVSPDLSTVKVKSGKKSNTVVKNDPSAVVLKVTSGKNSKRKVRITRESKKGQFNKDYEFPFEEPGESLLEYEHVFARPEYNSTLRLRSEIEEIKKSNVDMSKALEKKLQISDTKTNINEKAAAHVNTDAQFTGLVSLEVPLEDLCATAEKETEEKWRSLKTTHSKYKVSKSKEAKDTKEPDLLEFFTPDLQRETVELSVPSSSTPFETLATANHISAFDLYRHNRVWDGSSNFRIGK